MELRVIVYRDPSVIQQDDGSIRVTLAPWERETVALVGQGRVDANAGVADAQHYDPARMQDNLIASVAGVACEMATAKALNLFWSPSVWPRRDHARYAHLPDIAPDIEVRRIRDRRNPLAVRQRDHDRDRVMVLAYAVPDDFAEVELIGWCRAADAYPTADPAPWDRSHLSRLVPQDRLHRFAMPYQTWADLERAAGA